MATIRERKYIFLGATMVVAIAAAVGAVHLHGGFSVNSAVAAVAAPPPAQVDVAAVVAKNITEFQAYSGRLQAIDTVAVQPLVSGTIVAVHFKDGAFVKKGDPLFTIDPRPYVAQVDQAAAQLAAAKARDGYASTDAARAERLLADNAIAKRDYDEKQNAAHESAANVKAAQAALEMAKINLSYTHIVAPISGRASRAELTVGNVVSTGSNAPLLTTVVSMSPIYASFDVDEQTYLKYLLKDAKTLSSSTSAADGTKKGAGEGAVVASATTVPVYLGLADETGYSRTGRIDSIDNQLDTRSGTIRVRARFDNADGALMPGLYARVEVGGSAPHPAVMIDDAAIGTDQDKKFVMVVDKDSKAQYREVWLGAQHDGLRIIVKGLVPGERIIVNGLQRVRPNDTIAPHEVAMAEKPGATDSAADPS